MEQTNRYKDAIHVINNPDLYDEADAANANSFIEAYQQGYKTAQLHYAALIETTGGGLM